MLRNDILSQPPAWDDSEHRRRDHALASFEARWERELDAAMERAAEDMRSTVPMRKAPGREEKPFNSSLGISA